MLLVQSFITGPAVSAVVILALFALLPRLWEYIKRFSVLPGIPCVGLEDGTSFARFRKAKKRFMTDSMSLMIEGYKKYGRSGLFQLWTPDGFGVAISPELASEIKNVSENVLNFQKAIQDRILGRFMGLEHSPVAIKCIRQDLAKNCEKRTSTMSAEVDYALATHFGECQEWTEFRLHPVILQVVAIISGSIFVGVPRNRDPAWLKVAIMFTVDVFAGARALRNLPFPAFMYPITARFVPEVRRTHEHRAKARELISPIVKARLSGVSEPGLDMIQWLLDSSREKNPDKIAQQVLGISMASIHTTALTLTKVLFDLASRPEYMQPLREEAEAVLAEEGGVFTHEAVRKLDLFDSFLKESQRLSPVGLLTMNRRVVSPSGFTFSTGVHLPYGATILGVTSAAASRDPEIFENPDEFDGYRFQRLRNSVDRNQHAFSGTSTLHWGLGKHTCPGRFFASAEIKLLLAKIVMKYDVRTKDGRRPDDVCWELANSPDTNAFIEFRKRG